MKRYLFPLFLFALLGSCVAQVAPSNHVFVVVEENHSYSDISSTSMPYLTSLAGQYGLATNYYAATHPSIGNYFMLTTGQILTNNDGYSSTVTADNIVRHLLTAGKTFKEYSESIPQAGYTGGDAYPYVQHHNPLSYFSDVRNSSSAASVLVPFTQLASDIAANQLPTFGFIVPNNLNNAHDGSLATADNWLKNNIAPLIASQQFQQDGILVIVFDEAATSDTANGGGHVFAAIIGPKVGRGLRSTTLYQHQSVLKMLMTAVGVSSFPGAAENAPDMREFFTTAAPPPLPPTQPAAMSMAVSPASATITAGGTANFQVTLTPQSGTVGSSALSCGQLPAGVSCTFKPAVLTPGSAPATTTLTVATTAAKAGLLRFSGARFLALFVPLFGVVAIAPSAEQRRRMIRACAILAVVALGMLLQSCGGAANPTEPAISGATPPGSYTVTITATSASLQTSATAALTVR